MRGRIGACGGELQRGVLPPPAKLLKVFKADALSPDFRVCGWKKSYLMRFEAAKYS